jgi:hypothetical protein
MTSNFFGRARLETLPTRYGGCSAETWPKTWTGLSFGVWFVLSAQ